MGENETTSVRINREIYKEFRDYCEVEGFVPPIWIGKILKTYLKDRNWKKYEESTGHDTGWKLLEDKEKGLE